MVSNNFLNSIFDASNISGNDIKATTQAYTVINNPACDSETSKSLAMSVKSPIGINSEVLNTNAAHVSPTNGIQSFICGILINLLKGFATIRT